MTETKGTPVALFSPMGRTRLTDAQALRELSAEPVAQPGS